MAAKKKAAGVKPAPAGCSCVSDPLAALPPEARPRLKSPLDSLRQVICPGCGLKYWTNRPTDLCMDCEKRGVKINQQQ